jgi:hypothetical protein
MSTAASDDLIARVRAYLTSLEPPVPADDLSDDEVGEFVLLALTWMEVEEGMPHQLLPERFRPPPELPAMPPIEVTARVSEILQPYARFVEYGTNPPPPRPFLRRLLDPATPSEPPPRPH